MTKQELAAVLASHSAWMSGEAGGVRANLAGADLTGADLTRADLTDANLTCAVVLIGNRRVELK